MVQFQFSGEFILLYWSMSQYIYIYADVELTRRFLYETLFKARKKFCFFLTPLCPYRSEMKLTQKQLI
jgi:hypothetical protein